MKLNEHIDRLRKQAKWQEAENLLTKPTEKQAQWLMIANEKLARIDYLLSLEVNPSGGTSLSEEEDGEFGDMQQAPKSFFTF